ncbi:MAG: 16S rRNA (cytosine(1402)-N(4))-methyltransferase RsmH [Chitinivibrionales bacterium]
MDHLTYHTPVMLQESLDGLAIQPEGIYVDVTLGGGGHFCAIASRLNEDGTIVGIDRDPAAIQHAQRFEHLSQPRIILEQSRFSAFDTVLERNGIDRVHGILADLGVSSHQIDTAGRGFSYMQDSALDMRMGRQGQSASELIAQSDEHQLAEILSEYGEVRNAQRMARAIKRFDHHHPIRTSTDLRECLRQEYGTGLKVKIIAKVFQALRIAVNQELWELQTFLGKMHSRLSTGGRLVVISYHSLEDRMVKQFMRRGEQACVCPPELPVCRCGKIAWLKRISRSAIKPTEDEITQNRRARSARLRVAEKVI